MKSDRRRVLISIGAGALIPFSESVLGAGAAPRWSTGDTDSIAVDFPGDELFLDDRPLCGLSLTQPRTLGPCYFEDSKGPDISTGLTGLPMQLCFRLVDENCAPVAGHRIEAWHCDTRGVYSADSSNANNDGDIRQRFSARFCSGGDAAAQESSWFRGALVTDDNGRANFKSIFPGWYPGRTIHVHIRVSNDKKSSIVSQFCFPDTLTEEICTQHESYVARGVQDTPVEKGRDSVFRSKFTGFMFSTQRNPDGSILVYKTIQID